MIHRAHVHYIHTYVVHSSCKSHANHAFLCWPVILNVVGSHGGVGDAVVDHSIDADGDRVTRQHLLWRYIKWHRPEVHFLVAVRTWNDEKNTRPLGAPCGLKDGWTYFHYDLTLFNPPFLSRPSLKITERSYSATTLMQVQSEKGSVTITRSRASPVSTMAQNPGPSGSAANKKENVF